MPKRRRSSGIRRSVRRRIVSRRSQVGRPRRRLRVSRGRIGRGTNVHRYVRFVATPQTITCTGVEANGCGIFQLQDTQNYTELTALYDRYKITHVQARIQLVTNPNSQFWTNSQTLSQPTNWFPKLWYCKDYDDSNTETIAALKQRAGTKMFVLKPDKMYKVNIKPAILGQTYRTATTTGYAPMWKQWIDVNNADVPHYGWKYAIDADGLDPIDAFGFQVRIEYKYWITMKDVR